MSGIGVKRTTLLPVPDVRVGPTPHIGPDNEPLDDAPIIVLACDDLTIALGLLRSCLASVKP
jgi:hypothetical protein